MSQIKFFYSDYSIYESDEPMFYNPENYPEIKYIKDNYSIISEEVKDYVEGKFNINYKNPGAPEMTYPDSWKNVYFKNYLLKYKMGKKYFPKTHKLIDNNSNITLAGITTLAPRSKLKSHCGETNAIIRCHLGLKVPGKLPELGLSVKGNSITWEEGKVFAFNDAYQHEAWNNTDEHRYVLVFDFIRPEFANKKKWICATCLGIEAMRLILSKTRVYDYSPIWLRALISKPISYILYIYLVLKQN